MSNKLDNSLEQFESAVEKLSAMLKQEKNEYMMDSAIQRFKFTFELAWTVLKANLQKHGIIVYSARDSIKGAFKKGFIEDDPRWLEMIELRNMTRQPYNEETAQAIFAALPGLLPLYKKLLLKFKEKS